MKSHFYALLLATGLLVCFSEAFGQAVSINSTGNAPHPNAILDVSTNTTQGVLLARMTTATRAAWTPTTSGVTVYDINTESYWYWDDTANAWREIPNMTSIPAVSLDDAYNGGTFITADAGPVDIQGAGGLTVAGQTAINTTPQSDFKLSVLASSGTQGIYVNSTGASATKYGIHSYTANSRSLPIFGEQVSTSTGQAYYALRGRVVTPAETNGYLSYHTNGNNSYAVYGVGGTYAGFFDGNVNLTGELQINGSAGTSGQVLVSQGAGNDPIWGAAGVQSVTAGAGLTNSGTATAPVIDVLANNGLNVDAGADRIQLGGPLTEATTISLGAFDMTYDINSTGNFVIQDGGVPHFQIDNNDGNAFLGSDLTIRDGSTTGTNLIDFTDAGVGGNDGRIQVYADGNVNHTIHGDGNTVFNAQNLNRDFVIESVTDPNMFYLDASADAIGIGVSAPTAQFHTDGTLRFANYTNGFLQVDGTGNVSVATGSSLFTAGTGLSWSGTTLNSVWTQSGNEIYNNNTANVGIGTSTPDAKLNVGDISGATLYLTREDNVTVSGDVLGSLLFDSTDDTAPSSNDASAGIRAYASQDHGNSNKGGHLGFFTKNNVANSASATEHMRITAAGNIGIGDLTPDAKLDVDATSGNLLILAQNGTQRALVDINGNLTISGKMNSNGIEELSDRRFKKDITPLPSVLNKVLEIEGVTYKWRREEFPEKAFGERTEVGFIAQELEKYFPELVNTDKDGYKSVQYSHMVPVLLEAIKEQNHVIQQLSNELNLTSAKLEQSMEGYASLKNELGRIYKLLERKNPDVGMSNDK